jgi:RNA polymerase sigma factor (sigma-70 family)
VTELPFGVTPAQLLALVERMVRRAAGGISHDVGDAVQETALRLLSTDVHRFNPALGLEGFIAKRAMWTLRDMRRREASRGRVEAQALPAEPTTPASDELVAAAQQERLQTALAAVVAGALAELDEEARAVVEAHDLAGRPLRDLARAGGVNVSTLSRRRARGLDRLAVRLAPLRARG